MLFNFIPTFNFPFIHRVMLSVFVYLTTYGVLNKSPIRNCKYSSENQVEENQNNISELLFKFYCVLLRVLEYQWNCGIWIILALTPVINSLLSVHKLLVCQTRLAIAPTNSAEL